MQRKSVGRKKRSRDQFFVVLLEIKIEVKVADVRRSKALSHQACGEADESATSQGLRLKCLCASHRQRSGTRWSNDFFLSTIEDMNGPGTDAVGHSALVAPSALRSSTRSH